MTDEKREHDLEERTARFGEQAIAFCKETAKNPVTKVFFSGSRRLARLNQAIRDRADSIIAQGFTVLVGDATGADMSMQEYLAEQGYRKVAVFCTGASCRNNAGGWETRHIEPGTGVRRGFRFYTAKDEKMSEEATYGFVMWDGRSVGSLNNILNLLRQKKKVLVYFSPSKEFHTLETRRELATLLAEGGADTLDDLERQLRIKKGRSVEQEQLTFA